MMDSGSVITTAVEGIVKELAASMEVSVSRCYEMLGGQCSYQKAKILIRRIGALNPDGARLIKADLDAMFASILNSPVQADITDLHRESFEAIQSILNGKSAAEQKRELRELIAEAERHLGNLDAAEFSPRRAVQEFRASRSR